MKLLAPLLVHAQNRYKKNMREGMAMSRRQYVWDLSEKCRFHQNDEWYDHIPEMVLENEEYKLLWVFSIQTDYEFKTGIGNCKQKKENIQM